MSGFKADFADITNLSSVGSFKEWLPTTLEAGEVSFEGNYLGNADATQTALRTEFTTQHLGAWTIVLPLGKGTWTFDAYVADFGFDATVDKEMKLTGKLKVTGEPTFA
jgi:predicted secreted protein